MSGKRRVYRCPKCQSQRILHHQGGTASCHECGYRDFPDKFMVVSWR